MVEIAFADLDNIEFAIPFMHWYIYGLIDPRTNEVFYVGEAQYPKSRLGQHIWTVNSSKGNYASKQYIKILLSLGIRPWMLILDEVITSRGNLGDISNAYDLERYWIDLAKSKGLAWCNDTSILASDRESLIQTKQDLLYFANNRPQGDRNPHGYIAPDWHKVECRVGQEIYQNTRESRKPGPKPKGST